MNYKEKIFNDIIQDLKIKKINNAFNRINNSHIDSKNNNIFNLTHFNNPNSNSDHKKNNTVFNNNDITGKQDIFQLKSFAKENKLNVESKYFNSGNNNYEKIISIFNDSNKKKENQMYNNLIVKYNSEISVILKFFIKCLLNNYKMDSTNTKPNCIKTELKELILKCKLAKTIETFIVLTIKDEIRFEIDVISGYYDKPYLENLYL